jgi:hypothetical protein
VVRISHAHIALHRHKASALVLLILPDPQYFNSPRCSIEVKRASSNATVGRIDRGQCPSAREALHGYLGEAGGANLLLFTVGQSLSAIRDETENRT